LSDEQGDPLRLVLQHMEEQLDDRVDALSDAKPSSQESTADLIQLEEALSSAQDKAKKLVTLRLKLDEEAAAAGTADAAGRVDPADVRKANPSAGTTADADAGTGTEPPAR
jgi:hypothetical protein